MAARVMTRAYDDALRSDRAARDPISVLAAVGARGALSIKSLADTLQMERTTLTRNLRPLEEQGATSPSLPEARYRARMLDADAVWPGRARWRRCRSGRTPSAPIKRRLGLQRWPAVQEALAALAARHTRPQSP